MAVRQHRAVDVRDSSQVGSARRAASEIARRIGFSDTDVGRAAIVATELASNILKHGGGGQILLRPTAHGADGGLEMLALDRGRGMSSVAASLRDGYSTSGTPGTGLGAVSRLADRFDIHSASGLGTIVFALVGRDGVPPDAGSRWGVVCVAKPGETVSGDSWAVLSGRDRTAVMVVDGLGHGPSAATAAEASIRIFVQAPTASPREVLEQVHGGLHATRGAAAAVALIDRSRDVVRFAGIGNIAGRLLVNGATRSMVSQYGTAGHDVRRIQEFDYPLPRRGLLVMNSDGLVSSWDVKHYPDLLQRHPSVIAAVLYRDFSRGRDDATVVVLEEPQ